MKILYLDIETAPNLAYVWGLFKQNVATNQVEASSYVLCWAAKWHCNGGTIHYADIRAGEKEMLYKIHRMLGVADVVVHYNGLKFDIPTLNKEFAKHGLKPPAPYKQVDLMRAVKRAFRFESNKLDYVAQQLGLGRKVRHPGFDMWVNCMDKDRPGYDKAWKQMERYNRMDVKLLERLYKRLLPWLKGHPNRSAHEKELCCPRCASKEFALRTENYVLVSGTYARYSCNKCGHWFRGSKRLDKPTERGVSID